MACEYKNLPRNGSKIEFVDSAPSYCRVGEVYSVGYSRDKRSGYVGQVGLRSDRGSTHTDAMYFDMIGWKWRYVDVPNHGDTRTTHQRGHGSRTYQGFARAHGRSDACGDRDRRLERYREEVNAMWKWLRMNWRQRQAGAVTDLVLATEQVDPDWTQIRIDRSETGHVALSVTGPARVSVTYCGTGRSYTEFSPSSMKP